MKKNSAKEIQQIIQIIMPLAVLLGLTVLVFSAVTIVYYAPLESMPLFWHFNIAMDLFGMFVSLIILFSCILEFNYSEQTKAFTRLVSYICLNMFWDLCAWCFDGVPGNHSEVVMVNTLYFLTGYMITVSFWIYIRAELKLEDGPFHYQNILVYGIATIGFVATILNLKFEFFFTVSEDAVYSRTSLNWLCLVPAVIILVIVAIKVVQLKISASDKMLILSYDIFPVFAMIFQVFVYGLSILYPCVLLGALLIYGNIYLKRSRTIVEQQAKLSEQNIAIMVSQIQPHFLYNTLTTISNLCRKNPEKAEEATVMFSQYLRMNLDSLKKTEPVPFAAELNHVKIYLSLEQERFGEKLNVEYDIKEQMFLLPALSIQPIVENSVKHGICEKEEPGTVKISTDLVDDWYEVVIEDDGVGFDPSAPVKSDGRSHVGMQNVIDRLEKMSSAKVEVVSSPGNGCKTTIRIPKQRN